ncbi:MAG TPA: glycosyltransferase 87 family protein [Candidatus Limnocylindrales bacterium]|jgi:hypothetical protein
MAWLLAPVSVGRMRFPAPLIVVAAGIGALLLLVVATTSWTGATDEQAYWRAASRFAAGGSMYDPTAVPGDGSFGYWYPPPLAQLLAPFTSFIGADAFSILWTALLLGCLWWLAGGDVLVALALIAFLPVAVELRVRNIHLLLAVLTVLALRRSWLFWVPAAAIKVAPVIGIAFLAASRRWREAIGVALVGGLVLLASVLLAPSAWHDFFAIVVPRGSTEAASSIPIPFIVRFAGGAVAAVAAGFLVHRGRQREGEALLVLALTFANPTFWVTAFALLVAIVPLWRSAPASRPAGASLSIAAAAPR